MWAMLRPQTAPATLRPWRRSRSRLREHAAQPGHCRDRRKDVPVGDRHVLVLCLAFLLRIAAPILRGLQRLGQVVGKGRAEVRVRSNEIGVTQTVDAARPAAEAEEIIIMEETNLNQDSDQEEKERLMQLVGFVIGKELFGVDILMVQEIIRAYDRRDMMNK